MKNNSCKLKALLAGAMFVSFCFVSTNSAIAQKPKGEPWNAPEAAVKEKNPVKYDETSIKDGKEIFGQQCKSCHGVAGKGDGVKAEKLDITCGDFTAADMAKMTDGELYWKTTEGRKPMPSFKEKLSDTERWTVINYVRSLSKAK